MQALVVGSVVQRKSAPVMKSVSCGWNSCLKQLILSSVSSVNTFSKSISRSSHFPSCPTKNMKTKDKSSRPCIVVRLGKNFHSEYHVMVIFLLKSYLGVFEVNQRFWNPVLSLPVLPGSCELSSHEQSVVHSRCSSHELPSGHWKTGEF